MDYLLFDLDNTLYDAERDLFSLIDKRINRYMVEIVGIDRAEVDGLRRHYWQLYGVTLQGLIRHYKVDPEDYLRYVHDVDVTSKLMADPQLDAVLEKLPQRKAVFTNGSRCHAERVLAALEIRPRFEEIYDIRIADYLPKPKVEPYRAILDQLGISAAECVLIEDTLPNLVTAKELGMKTVFVGTPGAHPYVDRTIATVREVHQALQELRE